MLAPDPKQRQGRAVPNTIIPPGIRCHITTSHIKLSPIIQSTACLPASATAVYNAVIPCVGSNTENLPETTGLATLHLNRRCPMVLPHEDVGHDAGPIGAYSGIRVACYRSRAAGALVRNETVSWFGDANVFAGLAKLGNMTLLVKLLLAMIVHYAPPNTLGCKSLVPLPS